MNSNNQGILYFTQDNFDPQEYFFESKIFILQPKYKKTALTTKKKGKFKQRVILVVNVKTYYN